MFLSVSTRLEECVLHLSLYQSSVCADDKPKYEDEPSFWFELIIVLEQFKSGPLAGLRTFCQEEGIHYSTMLLHLVVQDDHSSTVDIPPDGLCSQVISDTSETNVHPLTAVHDCLCSLVLMSF